jgi:hypothetical protein
LQVTAARQTGMSEVLLVSVNVSGGVLGKTISLENLALGARPNSELEDVSEPSPRSEPSRIGEWNCRISEVTGSPGMGYFDLRSRPNAQRRPAQSRHYAPVALTLIAIRLNQPHFAVGQFELEAHRLAVSYSSTG